MQGHLKENGGEELLAKYKWERPSPAAAAAAASTSPAQLYDSRLSNLVQGTKIDRTLVDSSLTSQANLDKWAAAIEQITRDLLKEKSVYNASWKTNHLDVVRDVINLVPVHFLSTEIVRRLSLQAPYNWMADVPCSAWPANQDRS
jgi:hypothetical protein